MTRSYTSKLPSAWGSTEDVVSGRCWGSRKTAKATSEFSWACFTKPSKPALSEYCSDVVATLARKPPNRELSLSIMARRARSPSPRLMAPKVPRMRTMATSTGPMSRAFTLAA